MKLTPQELERLSVSAESERIRVQRLPKVTEDVPLLPEELRLIRAFRTVDRCDKDFLLGTSLMCQLRRDSERGPELKVIAVVTPEAARRRRKAASPFPPALHLVKGGV